MLRQLYSIRLDSKLLRNLNIHSRFNLSKYYSNKGDRFGHKNSNNNTKCWLTLGAVGVAAPNLNVPHQQRDFGQQNQSPFGMFPEGPYINWNQFCYQMLAAGEVERIVVDPTTNTIRVLLHDGAIINGIRPYLRQYILRVPSIDAFELKLRDFERSMGIKPGNEVPVIYERSTAYRAIVVTMVVAGILYFLSRNTKVSGPQSIMSSFSKAKFTLVDPAARANDAASVRFKDVAGLHEAKVEIMEFVDYLKNSERFIQLGAKLPKGVLLTGPPGCGKTLLAKAVATEANVPFLALSGSDFIEMIGGVGASRVRSLFKSANKLSPCIVYIDEIDSIGKKRGGSQFGNSEMEQTLNQLLVEMDGIVSRKGVILLASTNRADVLDQALLRPGRFDRQILIDLPNLQERREIFEKYASKIKLEDSISDFSLRIAQLTPGMSGADLANVCNEAALHAARKDKKVISKEDVEYAIERVVGGTEKRSSFMSAEEKKIIAYHECGHALVGWLLEHTDPVLKVSIVPRTSKVLGYAQYLPSDQKLYNAQQFFDRMCMALGGRVAELVKFNHLSTGAQDDLRRVTEMAMAQIKEYGFDPVVGNISFPKQEQYEKRPYSKRLANVMDHRAGIMVKEAFDKTQQLLNKHLDKLDLLAETLLAKEVISSSDIERLIGPRPHPNSQNKVDLKI